MGPDWKSFWDPFACSKMHVLFIAFWNSFLSSRDGIENAQGVPKRPKETEKGPRKWPWRRPGACREIIVLLKTNHALASLATCTEGPDASVFRQRHVGGVPEHTCKDILPTRAALRRPRGLAKRPQALQTEHLFRFEISVRFRRPPQGAGGHQAAEFCGAPSPQTPLLGCFECLRANSSLGPGLKPRPSFRYT